ncbi:MAG TPA: magnesium/cobalt transporter CorA [Phycisphaerae bacterium]|nr:magnesium/cobalt transporter CorA [Phycisphaerae bacterium]
MKRRRLVRSRSQHHGLPPGTPVYTGAEKAEPVAVTLIDYDEASVREEQVADVKALGELKDKPSVTWINVDGVHDAALVQSLAESFGLHPLVQEDILDTGQRAKVEDFEDYLYFVVKMLRWAEPPGEMVVEQVSLVLGRNFVISFQERSGDVFDPIRHRIRTGKGRIRKLGANYLAYSLLDAIVDGYFAVLEKLGEQIEAMEDQTMTRPSPDTLREIYRLKREGLFLRRSVWPVRELVGGLERIESPLIGDAISAYLRDLYDHTIQAIETTEALRDTLSGMLDTYLSSLSNRMNEVMKVLTIIATIFIPLTFIAGLYGMNFKFMPELEWYWAYPAVLIVMAAVGAVMLVFFRRRHWL